MTQHKSAALREQGGEERRADAHADDASIITPAAPTDYIDAAGKLVQNGYHPVPVAAGTKACKVIGWPRWCIAAPSPQDIAAWGSCGGLGLACGVATVCVDIDTPDEDEAERLEDLAVEHLGATPLRRVGKAPKRALVYRCAERTEPAKRVGLDIIGFGQMLVGFGVHPVTGKPYQWGKRSPLDTPVAELPAITAEQIAAFVEASGLPQIESEGGKLQPVVRDPATGLVIDGREAHLTLCVHRAARAAPDASPETWAGTAWDEFKYTADLLSRPDSKLSEREALKKARYAAKRVKEGKLDLKPKAQPAGAALLSILDEAELWRDERDEPWATVKVKGHDEHWSVDAPAFRLWLLHEFYIRAKKAPPKEALKQAIEQAAARARFDGRQHQTWLRVAKGSNGEVYLDLADDQWRAVEITAVGWRVVDRCPVKFRRSGQPLVEPRRGASIETLASFVNLMDEADLKLLAGVLVSYLMPDLPRPMLYIIGEMGSAKSSLLSLIVRLIDPQVVERPGPPNKEDDLVVTAQQRWVCSADNVSKITPDMADALCRLATGGGMEKRKHYTNEERHQINVKRPVVLTGIEVATERSDFLDRVVLMELAPLDEDRREEERILDARLAEHLPGILGALLDGVSAALANQGAAASRLKGKLPRLADFAVCAEAAGSAFGWKEGEFHAAYLKAIDERLGTAAESDRFVQLIAEWLPGHNGGRFEGGASDLLEALKVYVRSTGREVVLEEKWFPKSSVWLGRILPGRRRLLRTAGVGYTRLENPGTNSAQHKLVALGLQSDLPFEEW